ncbi:acyl-CoA thioesterase [bacterium]|nr:acyl-CoA thioesterase [bacterium]
MREVLLKTNSTFLVMPNDLNPFGTLFGGTMMSWMDKIAVLCAMEHTGRNCVTLFADQIKFHAPVHVQEVVDMSSVVIDEGITSLLIHVTANKRKSTESRENSLLVAESIFKFVSLDKNGNPTDKWKKRIHSQRSPINEKILSTGT